MSAPSRIEVVLMAFPLIAVLLLPFDCLRRRVSSMAQASAARFS